MTREQLSEKILDIKRDRNLSWREIIAAIGGLSDVLIVGALLGEMRLPEAQAARAAQFLGLAPSEQKLLSEIPMRGRSAPMPPTDPLLYRFYELVMVNGPAWKELIQEEFGDGIMSAIDFDMTLERLPDPKGDRVKIVMSGKFLPFKYYGADVDTPPTGAKEP